MDAHKQIHVHTYTHTCTEMQLNNVKQNKPLSKNFIINLNKKKTVVALMKSISILCNILFCFVDIATNTKQTHNYILA